MLSAASALSSVPGQEAGFMAPLLVAQGTIATLQQWNKWARDFADELLDCTL